MFAHEVRNPINNISTGLQLLSVKLPENDPNQENISRLLRLPAPEPPDGIGLNFSRHSEHKFEAVDLEALLRPAGPLAPPYGQCKCYPFFQCEENTPLCWVIHARSSRCLPT